LLSVVETGLAPHDVDVSADGRYLYVLSRGGRLVAVDLFLANPTVIASARIGFEARTLAAGDGYVVAGAYWPPQVGTFARGSLEPLRTLLLDDEAYELGRTQHRVTQVTALDAERFLAISKDAGEIRTFSTSQQAQLTQQTSVAAVRFLRAGSFDLSQRYFLVPADENQVVVFDVTEGEVVSVVATRSLLGGGRGTSYVDPEYGPVWAASAMGSRMVTVIGTDPEGYPDNAWRVLREIELPAGGSLHTAAHAAAGSVWVDMPLNAEPAYSGGVAVLDIADPGSGAELLDITGMAGISDPTARATHPQFDASGRQVWLTVYNRQDRESAIVVLDAQTRKVVRVIRDDRLVTPIRTFNLARLMNN
jgi:nitrite reductase (NO-forming)/hydroxylamine reductase